MDTVEIKFSNFIVFIKGLNIPMSPQVLAFLNMPFTLFLQTIKTHSKDKTVVQIVKLITEKLNINLKDYSQSDIDKFKKYIKYFLEISKV